MWDKQQLKRELNFKAVKSSGSGGQHVNKVSSKVELSFDLEASKSLSESQKALIKVALKNRLTKDHILVLQCDESRSQNRNKTLVIERCIELIEQALVIPKDRKTTKIPRAVKEKRSKLKRSQSEKKAQRRKPNIEE